MAFAGVVARYIAGVLGTMGIKVVFYNLCPNCHRVPAGTQCKSHAKSPLEQHVLVAILKIWYLCGFTANLSTRFVVRHHLVGEVVCSRLSYLCCPTASPPRRCVNRLMCLPSELEHMKYPPLGLHLLLYVVLCSFVMVLSLNSSVCFGWAFRGFLFPIIISLWLFI